jgi:hypothetical protein
MFESETVIAGLQGMRVGEAIQKAVLMFSSPKMVGHSEKVRFVMIIRVFS